MIKWTTPRVKCTIPKDLPLDYVLLTLKQNALTMKKTIQAAEVDEGVFYVDFTQEETSQFNLGFNIDVQVNIMSGNTRLASRILQITPTRNLHNEVIT